MLLFICLFSVKGVIAGLNLGINFNFLSFLFLQSNQIRQMEEFKISKKSKVGILPFVTGFEEFAELAETIFRNAERRGDLDKAYVKLIRAVFMNGETTDH